MGTDADRSSWLDSCTLLLAWLLINGAAAAHADMTGKWLIEKPGGATVFIDVEQDFDRVAFGLDGFYFTGDLSGLVLRATAFDSPGRGVLDAVVSLDQTRLRARMGSLALYPGYVDLVGVRCRCFDGNRINHDGCDVWCQIEQCFTCDTPSACHPSATTGLDCDDGNVCTSGETCTAGICGGGAAVVPCTDVSGTWRWRETLTDPLPIEIAYPIRLTQNGTFLEALSPAYGVTYAGSIDPGSGDFELHAIGSVYGCDITRGAGADGRASDDEHTLTGSALSVAGPPPSCAAFPATLMGYRCGGNEPPCVTCPGDCNGDGTVTIDDLVRSVAIALQGGSVNQCAESDADVDGVVSVGELVGGVRSLLRGCE